MRLDHRAALRGHRPRQGRFGADFWLGFLWLGLLLVYRIDAAGYGRCRLKKWLLLHSVSDGANLHVHVQV